MKVSIFAFALVLFLSAAAFTADAVKRNDRIIKRGDLISITISDLTAPGVDSTTLRQLDRDGKINLPFLEKLVAKGLTCAQLETAISKAYRDSRIIQNSQVSVNIVEEK